MTDMGFTKEYKKSVELIHYEVDERLYEVEIDKIIPKSLSEQIKLPLYKYVEKFENGEKYYYVFQPQNELKRLTEIIPELDYEKVKLITEKLLKLLVEVENNRFKFFMLAPDSIYIDQNYTPYIFLYYPVYYENANYEWNRLEIPIKIVTKDYSLETRNSQLISELFSYMLFKDDYRRQERKDRPKFAVEKMRERGYFDVARWLEVSYRNSYKLSDCLERYRIALENEDKRTLKTNDQAPAKYKTASYSFLGRAKIKETDDYEETSKVNQDAYVEKRIDKMKMYLIAVMDGVSTSAIGNGNEASQIAKKALVEMFLNTTWSNVDDITSDEVEDFFRKYIEKANSEIVQRALDIAKEEGKSIQRTSDIMATTFTGVLVINDRFYMCSVGDSPCYIFNKEEIKRINIEHNSRTENLLKGFGSTENKALTEVLGKAKKIDEGIQPETPKYHFVHGRILPGELIAVMSDGVIDFSKGSFNDEKEENFKSLFFEKYEQNRKLKQTVVDVLKEIDNSNAGDNITLCVLEPIFPTDETSNTDKRIFRNINEYQNLNQRFSRKENHKNYGR